MNGFAATVAVAAAIAVVRKGQLRTRQRRLGGQRYMPGRGPRLGEKIFGCRRYYGPLRVFRQLPFLGPTVSAQLLLLPP